MFAIVELDDESLKADYSNKFKNMLIIDIREPDEYMKEHIPGSQNVPLSRFVPSEVKGDREQPVMFHCGIGMRTRKAIHLIEATGFKEIYCLEGGIAQWKRCGLPLNKDKKAPIEINRQVHIILGILLLLSLILGITINSNFLWLNAFIGTGLIVMGLTGFCGLAILLSHMPWNKK